MQGHRRKATAIVALASLVLVTVYGAVRCDKKAKPKQSLCRRVCEKMKSCGKVLKYEDELNDPAKCSRECEKDLKGSEPQREALHKCLAITRCRPYLACVLGAATKQKKKKNGKGE